MASGEKKKKTLGRKSGLFVDAMACCVVWSSPKLITLPWTFLLHFFFLAGLLGYLALSCSLLLRVQTPFSLFFFMVVNFTVALFLVLLCVVRNTHLHPNTHTVVRKYQRTKQNKRKINGAEAEERKRGAHELRKREQLSLVGGPCALKRTCHVVSGVRLSFADLRVSVTGARVEARYAHLRVRVCAWAGPCLVA